MNNTAVPVICVDGGGTGTRASLCSYDSDGRVCLVGETLSAGPSNPNDIGEESSVRLISDLCLGLINSAFGAADRPVGGAVIYAGLSGAVGHEKILEKGIAEALGDRIGQCLVRVEADIMNLFGFLPEDADAAALIAGTGSVCFVRLHGKLSRIGGWGYLLDGDCGGGYALGRAGLEAALRAADGRDGPTLLRDAARDYLGDDIEAPGTVAGIYERGKAFIAGFAPYVIDAVADGDAAARSLLARNAEGLAGLASAACGKAGRGIDIICSGGLFASELFTGEFRRSLLSEYSDCRPVICGDSQLMGAAVQAMRTAEKRKQQ